LALSFYNMVKTTSIHSQGLEEFVTKTNQ
jgi:hypothetical protein